MSVAEAQELRRIADALEIANKLKAIEIMTNAGVVALAHPDDLDEDFVLAVQADLKRAMD